MVVQAAERARNVRALGFLDLEHQFADICRNRVHTESVQASLEHMGLDAYLVERRSPLADRNVGILSIEEVHLLESAAVCLDAVEATHINDGRSHPYELVNSRLILA